MWELRIMKSGWKQIKHVVVVLDTQPRSLLCMNATPLLGCARYWNGTRTKMACNPHSEVTTLFSMRTGSLVLSQSCHSVDAAAWCKRALTVFE